MAESIYDALQKQLDQYSTGFPKTTSGIEIKILKKMFTEQDAAMYLDLSMMLEPPESIAERTGRDIQAAAIHLEEMAKKGLIFRLRKDRQVLYAAVAFVIGSYEFQLNHMDQELAEMVETYFEEVMLAGIANNVVPLRTIPVNTSVDMTHPVAPYDDAREIIKTKQTIAVADCICRKQQGLLDKGCGKPLEVCLVFGSHAKFYVENNMARIITQEEAIAILDQSEQAGLVNQPANMINPGGMCNCCGDCCGVLRGLRKLDKPADMVFNNYTAAIDADLCTACETCMDRCQMEAIVMNDDQIAEANPDRCIGCGLCVTTCPVEAVQLILKPEDKWQNPPSGGKELMMITAQKRGTSLVPLSMAEK